MTVPFLNPGPSSPALYGYDQQPGIGHPLSQTRWFTGDATVPGFSGHPQHITQPQGSGIPYNSQYGGFGAATQAANPQSLWGKMGGMQGLNQGVSAFSNLAGIYAGFKSLGLAKDQFKFAKSSFNKNFNASAQAYNNQLRDRWESKTNQYAQRGLQYESMDSWMGDRQIDKVNDKNKNRRG